MYRTYMVVIVQIRGQKQCGRNQRGDHHSAMCSHAPARDVTPSHQQQHGTGGVERRVDYRINCVLIGNLRHAAGLVVRRLTMMKERPNMSAENSTRVAREEGKGKNSGLAG